MQPQSQHQALAPASGNDVTTEGCQLNLSDKLLWKHQGVAAVAASSRDGSGALRIPASDSDEWQISAGVPPRFIQTTCSLSTATDSGSHSQYSLDGSRAALSNSASNAAGDDVQLLLSSHTSIDTGGSVQTSR